MLNINPYKFHHHSPIIWESIKMNDHKSNMPIQVLFCRYFVHLLRLLEAYTIEYKSFEAIHMPSFVTCFYEPYGGLNMAVFMFIG
jgi:hypothetical protein